MGALRRGVTWVFRRICRVYFRRVEVVGEVPHAGVRGRLFCSNHVNGILDPILVFLTAGCDISPVAKSTLWKVPVLRSLLGVVDSVKIVRRTDDPTKQGGSNDRVFDEVAGWLLRGGNILIFPEGTSHNEPHLVELKTGAARMLQRASELGPSEDLTLQSIALEFDAREEARSRVLLIYGPVRRVADLGAASEGSGAQDALAQPAASSSTKGFIESVTEVIRDDLSERLVEGATWEERRFVSLAAEMLANDAGDGSLAGWNAMGRKIEAAKKAKAAEPGSFDAATEAVTAYSESLARLGIRDADVLGAPMGTWMHKVSLSLILPLSVIGLLAYAIPAAVTGRIAGGVKSHDETGTIRMGAALVLFPSWAVWLIGLSLWLAPSPWNLLLAALALLSPFAAIPWIDAFPVLRGRLRVLRAGARLEEARRARATAITRLREMGR